jgi:hypothetical protein
VEPARVKKNSLILIGVFFFAYLSNFFFAGFLNGPVRQHPFPLHGVNFEFKVSDVAIADATRVDYFAKAVAWIVVLVGLFYIMPEQRELISCILTLYIGYVVEFVIIYNDPLMWYRFGAIPIPVGYSTAACLWFIGLYVSYKYFKK